jgi:hypothetical protein
MAAVAEKAAADAVAAQQQEYRAVREDAIDQKETIELLTSENKLLRQEIDRLRADIQPLQQLQKQHTKAMAEQQKRMTEEHNRNIQNLQSKIEALEGSMHATGAARASRDDSRALGLCLELQREQQLRVEERSALSSEMVSLRELHKAEMQRQQLEAEREMRLLEARVHEQQLQLNEMQATLQICESQLEAQCEGRDEELHRLQQQLLSLEHQHEARLRRLAHEHAENMMRLQAEVPRGEAEYRLRLQKAHAEIARLRAFVNSLGAYRADDQVEGSGEQQQHRQQRQQQLMHGSELQYDYSDSMPSVYAGHDLASEPEARLGLTRSAVSSYNERRSSQGRTQHPIHHIHAYGSRHGRSYNFGPDHGRGGPTSREQSQLHTETLGCATGTTTARVHGQQQNADYLRGAQHSIRSGALPRAAASQPFFSQSTKQIDSSDRRGYKGSHGRGGGLAKRSLAETIRALHDQALALEEVTLRRQKPS